MELKPKIESILVEGHGVDALLAALSIRRTLPELKVVVKQSPGDDDPIGELVTPFLLHHLTGPCGIRLADLHRYARPTLALGFRYRWGRRGEFPRSFDAAPAQKTPAASCEAGFLSAIDDKCAFTLGEALMRARKVIPTEQAVQGRPGGGITGLQIRPDRLTDLLRRACEAVGVTSGDETTCENVLVVRTAGNPAEAGDFIEAPEMPVGRRMITGLRRRASDRLNPYATVETQTGGWSWRIEHDDSIGIGLGYDPEHLDDAQARDWLRSKLGEPVGEIRSSDWTPGRVAAPWSDAGVVIGDAAGFVAPFTGIRLPMLILEVQTLCRLLKEMDHRPGQESRRLYTRIIGRARDELRDFTGLYLAHAGRDDDGFWQAAASKASVGDHAQVLQLFQTGGPSGLIVNALPTVPGVIGIGSWVASFLGLGIDFRGRGEISDRDRAAWKSVAGELQSQARRGIEHEQALVAARR